MTARKLPSPTLHHYLSKSYLTLTLTLTFTLPLTLTLTLTLALTLCQYRAFPS